MFNATGTASLGTYTSSGGTYSFNANDAYVPMRACYAMVTPTAGSHSVSVKAVLLHANGGMTAASPAGTLANVAWVFPTLAIRPLSLSGYFRTVL